MVRVIKKIVPDLPFEKPLLRFMVAALLALALHSSFFLFSSKHEVYNDKEKNKKYVSLLPVNTSLLSEKKLLQWMKIMNPTIAVKPNRKNGFSIAPKIEKPKDIPLLINKHFLQLKKGVFLPLRLPVKSLAEKYEKLWAYNPHPIFKIDAISNKKIDTPLIAFEDETLPIIHFTDDDKKTITSILSSPHQAIRHFTLLKVSFPIHSLNLKSTSKTKPKNEPFSKFQPLFIPRIQIIKSSGNEDLDRFAVKKLSLLFINDIIKNTPNEVFVTVKWN